MSGSVVPRAVGLRQVTDRSSAQKHMSLNRIS